MSYEHYQADAERNNPFDQAWDSLAYEVISVLNNINISSNQQEALAGSVRSLLEELKQAVTAVSQELHRKNNGGSIRILFPTNVSLQPQPTNASARLSAITSSIDHPELIFYKNEFFRLLNMYLRSPLKYRRAKARYILLAAVAHEIYHLFQLQRFSHAVIFDRKKSYNLQKTEEAAFLYTMDWLKRQPARDINEYIGRNRATVDIGRWLLDQSRARQALRE